MDIYKYIETCTKIDADQRVDDVEWFSVPKSEDVNLPYWKNLPYHLEIEKEFHYQSNMDNLEHQNDEYQWRYQFADIRASVREVGLGWNVFSILEKRYLESQQKYAEKNLNESCSGDSNYSYTTANSVITDDSYTTAIEDFEYMRRSSEDIKSDISIDSSIDKSRYKKNALITKLLQNAENNLSNSDQVLIDYSTNECDTPNLFSNICIEKKNEHENNNKEKWDNNISETNMYEDRVFRLFQSKEDEDVYVHPLKEQIQEDPEWQKFCLSRKGTEVTETPRHYYMNLPEDQFEIFEKVETKKKCRTRRRVTKNRYIFK